MCGAPCAENRRAQYESCGSLSPPTKNGLVKLSCSAAKPTRSVQPMYTMLARSIIAAAASAFVGVTPLAAQDWPTRALTMVVGFAPGGGTDVLGRITGRRLSE